MAEWAPPFSVDPESNPGLAQGLRFVDLNLTPRVFLRVLRFSSLSKIDSQLISSGCDAVLVGHAWIVSGAECLAGSTAPSIRPC